MAKGAAVLKAKRRVYANFLKAVSNTVFFFAGRKNGLNPFTKRRRCDIISKDQNFSIRACFRGGKKWYK
jgi:hypothetical protein